MKRFEKVYIGKGHKPVDSLDIVRVTVKKDLLDEFVYNREGVEMITFEVSPLQQADKFGRTHTVYCTRMVEGQDKEQGNGKPSKASRVQASPK